MADMQIVPACKNVEAQYVEMMVPPYVYRVWDESEEDLISSKRYI